MSNKQELMGATNDVISVLNKNKLGYPEAMTVLNVVAAAIYDNADFDCSPEEFSTSVAAHITSLIRDYRKGTMQ